MASRSPQRPLRSKSNGSTTPTIPETKPVSYTPKCTPEEYIKAIAHHSQQSSAETLYPGDIYDTLTQFLELKPNILPNTANCPPSSDFAWLISPGQSGQQASSDRQSLSERHSISETNTNQRQLEGFTDPDSCIEALRSKIEISHPQILFLRGHPSPSWLSKIGAFCYVDPELFRWFLRYRAGPGSDYYFDSAPSTMSNIFRFKFFTIGSKNRLYRSSQREIDALRRKAANEFQRYQAEIKGNWALKPGDSIVRNFHVLDERHCLIEQEIVISIFDVGKTWMAIACTDAGHDLAQGPRFPWLTTGVESLPITLLPIFQYRPKCALKSRSINNGTAEPKKGRNTQSLAVFPEDYGRGLDWSLAKSDRFHILSDLFRLAAFSQKQLLNVMKEKITTETNRLSLGNENPTLANLLYFRDILQDQLSNISHMLQLTNNQNNILQNGRRPSIIISTDQRGVTDYAVAEAHALFEDLHSQAQSLQERCTQEMTVISNNSMLAESERAIQQAKSITKLTIVAFVYLPFTFTAGFFGMNFKELGSGTIPLWIFFAASLPLMLVTMGIFALDAETIRRVLRVLRIAYREPPYLA
ncbi:hypothetical protein N7457_000924 [Penicillium paradoxum]|uniref:uncharacterized protein n=1 Tax=Penicillium paradoxum TaxID=176176 RepID=UPI0025481B09|nr:uncharacterized protein N7457_000924 [Penicillium paradoxum]KAJ5794325.1 hypothetical protein N7457_000924 [Penicillium paradoxum]